LARRLEHKGASRQDWEALFLHRNPDGVAEMERQRDLEASRRQMTGCICLCRQFDVKGMFPGNPNIGVSRGCGSACTFY
jgi:hypothetical protein